MDREHSRQQQFTAVFFRDYETGYVVGSGNVILKTIDGGAHWNPETIGTTGVNYTDLTVLDNNQLIISGSNGSVSYLQDMKDEFASLFWYDALGRLVVSQNAKQYNKTTDHLTYSYTVYDNLGRIEEVGEIHATAAIENQYVSGVLNKTLFTQWLQNDSKTEITKTFYDLAKAPSVSNFRQEHLRKRVSAMYVYNTTVADSCDHATYYSYDVHGNVKSLLQENKKLGAFNSNQRYKRIDYDYDLISGNVKAVNYQDGKADAFYHKYLYDADNRITHVYTSKDKVIWDEDVKYFYYKHGPLARTEIGNEKVQGSDYAYTLQGWIKGINSTNLTALNDIGKDGELTQSSNVNKNIAKDVYSYSLNYYLGNGSTTKDYKAIGTGANSFIASTTAAAYIQTNAPDLYNGNISSMMTSILLDSTGAASPQLTTYRYDQLNRIKEMNAYRNGSLAGNDWAGASNDSSYRSKMSYDANGNIEYMLTNGYVNGLGKRMDELHYVYETKSNGYKRNTNKLRQVTDNATSTYTSDIKTQDTNNYKYDEIGNLTYDKQEEIEEIAWTVYGKIKSITRKSSSHKSDLEFTYDASGNRISKIEKPRSGSGVLAEGEWTTTYYTRDANGHVMSTYKKRKENSTIDLYLQEQDVYGSSRTGVQNRNLNLTTPPAATPNIFTREVGQKEYELSNHLGNVLTTVSDKRIPHQGTGGVIDYYSSIVKSSGDFSPFGAQMTGRGKNGSYRYGFNGKENDKETVGTGQGTQDYGMRIYNPSLGKFLSVDPLTKSYPMLTPYQFASNKPINSIDIDGLESADVYHYLDADGNYTGESEIKLRNVNGVMGDGILNHQLLMTSDNPGAMVQNLEYKEDFSLATYSPTTEAIGNSLKTDKMMQAEFEKKYPIVKDIQRGSKAIKLWAIEADNALEGKRGFENYVNFVDNVGEGFEEAGQLVEKVPVVGKLLSKPLQVTGAYIGLSADFMNTMADIDQKGGRIAARNATIRVAFTIAGNYANKFIDMNNLSMGKSAMKAGTTFSGERAKDGVFNGLDNNVSKSLEPFKIEETKK